MSAPFYKPGRYRCQITQQGIGAASTGNPQFVLKFTVLEYENGEPVEQQWERTAYNTITEGTMPYLIKKLAALGYTHGSLKYLDPAQPGFQSFKGETHLMFCQHESGQDGVREKWEIAFSGGSSEPLELKAVDANKMRQLDVLFGAASKSSRPAAAAKANPPTIVPAQQRNVAVDDGDVPF